MPTIDNQITFDSAMAMARQSLYRFTALALLDPKAGAWQKLHALRNDTVLPEAAAFLRDIPGAMPDDSASGERPRIDLDPSVVLRRLPETAGDLNEQYENTFGLLVSGACPPYEIEYINSKFASQRSNSLADINGFYQAFGVTTSQQHAERPDHIVQELEFMAFLIGLERQANGIESPLREERLHICREAQERFLREHLAWWAPAFASLLAREDPGGFYEATAHFLSALIAVERGLLRIPPTDARPATSTLDRPDSCEGCVLG